MVSENESCLYRYGKDLHIPLRKKIFPSRGGVPERLNGTVSKTVDLFLGSVGSNPTPSAIHRNDPIVGRFVVLCMIVR